MNLWRLFLFPLTRKIPEGWYYCSKQMPGRSVKPREGGRLVVVGSGMILKWLCHPFRVMVWMFAHIFYNNAIPSGLSISLNNFI